VAALKGIDMSVPEDGIVTIIGANGAGKSTTLRAISGLVPISKGEILFAGKRIDKLQPERIVAIGIAHVPEGRRVFPNLTVEENLRTGAFLRSDKAGIETDLHEVFDHFPRLKERRKQWARSLSGGEQQMLAIGRALMSSPRLLLIDEASLGLSPALAKTVFQVVQRINDDGVTVIIVEQNVGVLPYADRALIMEKGTLIFSGVGDEIRHANLRETYLGGEHE
jgi:branched-chain amino acid transport system ATP-binding protein